MEHAFSTGLAAGSRCRGNRTPRATLAALALAACATSDPPARPAPASTAPAVKSDSFAGCRGIHRDASTDELTCGPVRLWVRSGLDPASGLDQLVTSYIEANHDEPLVQPWVLDDAGTHGRRIRNNVGTPLESVELVAAARRGGAVRFVICRSASGAPGDDLDPPCRGVAAAALDGVPASVFAGSTTPVNPDDAGRFVGEDVAVPEGCRRGSPANIDCGPGGQVTWVEQRYSPEPLSARLAAAVAELRRGTSSVGGTLEGPDEQACRVGGQAARCTRHVWTYGGKDVVVIHALGEVRGQAVMVACSWERGLETGGDPPRPCDALLAY